MTFSGRKHTHLWLLLPAGLKHYGEILRDTGFRYSFSLTLLWAGTGTVLSLLFGFLIAVRLLKKRGIFSRFLYPVLLVPWGIPVFIAVPLLFLTDDARYTIGIKLYSFVGSVASGNPKWSLFAAVSVVNLIAISVFFLRFMNPLQTTTIEETEA